MWDQVGGEGNLDNNTISAISNSIHLHQYTTSSGFYRVMHFSAKRGIAIACRLSFCLSITLVDCDHIGWKTSEIISPLVSLECSLSADPNIMGLLQGEHPKFGPKVTHPLLIWASDLK